MEQRNETLCLGMPGNGVPVMKTPSGYILSGALPDGNIKTYALRQQYLGVDITDELAHELWQDGQTRLLLFTQSGGQHDYGRVVLTATGVTAVMERHYLQGRCPVCGGRVVHTSRGYFCEHYKDGDLHACQFHALGVLAHRHITEQEMEDFLAGHAEILDGFRADDNTPFSGYLVLNAQKMLAVCSRICRCPVCGGMLYARPNGFRCEHYYDAGHPCKTFFYKDYGGVTLTRRLLQQLSDDGITEVIVCLRDDGRRYPARLKLGNSRSRINIIQQ